MKGQKKTCLFLDYHRLPTKIQGRIEGWNGFDMDCCLIASMHSEFDVEAYRKGIDSVIEYWGDQVETNNFKGNFEKFIEDYGLEFDVWVIKQKFDLTGIDEIVIEI